MFAAVGLPFGPNMRTRLFSGVPVRRLSSGYPIEPFITSRMRLRAIASSPVSMHCTASSSSAQRCSLPDRVDAAVGPRHSPLVPRIARCFFAFKFSIDRYTGQALARFTVNTAAAFAGAVETTKERSYFNGERLIPQCIPDATNPFAEVNDPCFNKFIPATFFITMRFLLHTRIEY